MPETWSKLLFTYGPFALLVFVSVVLERRAYSQWKETHRSARSTTAHVAVAGIVYLCTWLTIFLTCGVITYVWLFLNVRSEMSVRGRLTGLQGTEQVTATSNDLYLRRIYAAQHRFDVSWRIISPARLPPGTLIDLYLDLSSSDHEDVTVYELPVTPNFYDTDQEVVLSYDRNTRALVVVSDGNRQLRAKKPSAQARPESSHEVMPGWIRHWLPTIFAQGDQAQLIGKRLESSDAIIRTKARGELAELGSAALPFIQQILGDPSSSYRLKLGVIVALNAMTTAPTLGEPSQCAIVEAARNSDETLQEHAKKYLESHQDAGAVCGRFGALLGRLNIQQWSNQSLSDSKLRELGFYVGEVRSSGSGVATPIVVFRRSARAPAPGATLKYKEFAIRTRSDWIVELPLHPGEVRPFTVPAGARYALRLVETRAVAIPNRAIVEVFEAPAFVSR